MFFDNAGLRDVMSISSDMRLWSAKQAELLADSENNKKILLSDKLNRLQAEQRADYLALRTARELNLSRTTVIKAGAAFNRSTDRAENANLARAQLAKSMRQQRNYEGLSADLKTPIVPIIAPSSVQWSFGEKRLSQVDTFGGSIIQLGVMSDGRSQPPIKLTFTWDSGDLDLSAENGAGSNLNWFHLLVSLIHAPTVLPDGQPNYAHIYWRSAAYPGTLKLTGLWTSGPEYTETADNGYEYTTQFTILNANPALWDYALRLQKYVSRTSR